MNRPKKRPTHRRAKEKAALALCLKQLRIVEVLRGGSHSIAEIAEETDIQRNSIYSQISRMRKQGLIATNHELMRAENARKYPNAIISLTADGEKVAEGFKVLAETLGPRLCETLLRC